MGLRTQSRTGVCSVTLILSYKIKKQNLAQVLKKFIESKFYVGDLVLAYKL